MVGCLPWPACLRARWGLGQESELSSRDPGWSGYGQWHSVVNITMDERLGLVWKPQGATAFGHKYYNVHVWMFRILNPLSTFLALYKCFFAILTTALCSEVCGLEGVGYYYYIGHSRKRREVICLSISFIHRAFLYQYTGSHALSRAVAESKTSPRPGSQNRVSLSQDQVSCSVM